MKCASGLPKIGGLFPDGFHATTIDGIDIFFPRQVVDNEKSLRALIGIRDGIGLAPNTLW